MRLALPCGGLRPYNGFAYDKSASQGVWAHTSRRPLGTYLYRSVL